MDKGATNRELKIKPSPIRPYFSSRDKSQLLRRRSFVMVVHILVDRLSAKSKDDLSTLRKFPEVDLFTPACYSNHVSLSSLLNRYGSYRR